MAICGVMSVKYHLSLHIVGKIIMPSIRLSSDVGKMIRTFQYTRLKIRLSVAMETYAQIELLALNSIYSSKLLE